VSPGAPWGGFSRELCEGFLFSRSSNRVQVVFPAWDPSGIRLGSVGLPSYSQKTKKTKGFSSLLGDFLSIFRGQFWEDSRGVWEASGKGFWRGSGEFLGRFWGGSGTRPPLSGSLG